MSGSFQVDLEVLQQFIGALRESNDHTQTALKAMASVDAAQIGTDELDSAADDFQKSWHYGVKRIGSMIKETTDGIGKVHAAYQEAEDAIVTVMDQMRPSVK